MMSFTPPIIQAHTDAAYAAFRKSFDLRGKAEETILRIFADRRYLLWINGQYIQRGPMRFDPLEPYFDQCEVSAFLHEGKNSLAVLVLNRGSNGQMMEHDSGLAVHLTWAIHGVSQSLTTDETWHWSDRTGYGEPDIPWGAVIDRVDGNTDDALFWEENHDHSAWPTACLVSSAIWGGFRERPIPLLREEPVAGVPLNNTLSPWNIAPEEEMIFDLGKMVHGYLRIHLDAAVESEIEICLGARLMDGRIEYWYKHTYRTRRGVQVFTNTDTSGGHYIGIRIVSGQCAVLRAEAVDCRYPYEEVGAFVCNDQFLNELWKRATHTVLMCSTDAYLDCAWRERTEWMGDGAVVTYPISRVCFAGPVSPGNQPRSDSRLMEALIRRVSITQTPDGRLKAHHPSDRFDIHAYIEDYTCLWVQALREVHDHTGNTELLREMWPILSQAMQWFAGRTSPDGLLQAREFVLFDNPLKYQECEGATVNAFYYRALLDSSKIAEILEHHEDASLYRQRALDLRTQYHKVLWSEDEGTYHAGRKDGALLKPSAHAALLALDRDIVPSERQASVRSWLMKHCDQPEGIHMPYTYFWLFDVIYRERSLEADAKALQMMRDGWAEMLQRTDTGTVTEFLDQGGIEPCHCMGAVPAYFLSTYVLGVRCEGVFPDLHLLVNPRPGDLTRAEGRVVTSIGLVPVSWEQLPKEFVLNFEVPPGAIANVDVTGIRYATRWLADGMEVSREELHAQLFRSGSHMITAIN